MAYTNENGNITKELGYDAWGRRRNPDTWACYEFSNRNASSYDNGFTGHEHIDWFDMINMDGRMYDPVVGRFMSPDPYVQAPDFTQSLNRYAYCINNPLSLTDPSGYNWIESTFSAIVGIAVGIETGGLASGVYGAIVGGALGGASASLMSSIFNGANLWQTAKSTFTGAFWGAASGTVNFEIGNIENVFSRIAAHTAAEGAMEGIRGGHMEHGLLMGLTSSTGGALINKYGTNLTYAERVAVNATLGGVVSELGGGKFASGAMTAAYSMMFNDLAHSIKFKNIDWEKVYNELKELYETYSEETNPDLYKNMGGKIRSEVYMKYPERTHNACALKLCIALDKAGFYFPKTSTNIKAGNGRYYFVSAKYLYDYLRNNYSQYMHEFNGTDELRSQMSYGIYYQNGNWSNSSITGHIDAMYNGKWAGHMYKKPINIGFY